MGKMQDVASEGRTVIFVSHDITAINTMTQNCILLNKGEIQFHGQTKDCLKLYLNSTIQTKNYLRENSTKSDTPHIAKISLKTKDIENAIHISGDEMTISFEISHQHPIIDACLSFQIINQFQQPVLHCWVFDQDIPICRMIGPSILECKIPRLNLNIGDYSITCHLSEPPGRQVFETLEGVCHFTVRRINKQRLWGWQASDCTYFEDFYWDNISISKNLNPQSGDLPKILK